MKTVRELRGKLPSDVVSSPERLATSAQRVRRSVQSGRVATLWPGYFALVMATGIVSLAAHLRGWEWIALGLFGFNLVAYAVLWVFTLARFGWFRRRLIEDLTHHRRGAGFLTAAAASCVLGSQFALLTPWVRVAEGLWVLGTGLSLALSYAFLAAISFRELKPSLEAGINGTWLLMVVAAESVSVLGALVAPAMGSTGVVLFISVAAHLVGAMLYVWFTTLIVYRLMFFRVRPEQLTADYWIGMGALAITTLAGALLIKANNLWGWLQALAPFLTGLMICFWAGASWWIPLLLAMELWRHLKERVPLSYGPEYWALVFPLGMYAVATFMLVRVTGLTFLDGVTGLFTYIAVIAWAITFAGMIHDVAGCRRSRIGEQSEE